MQLSFGATPALRGASLTVAAGEILAVMGPSGSGKSTLLHCLAGILKPDRGEVLFAGRRVDTMGEQARSSLRRDHFGFVFQFGQLVPELTAEENVALPLAARWRRPIPGARRGPSLVRAASVSRGWSGDDPGSCPAARPSGSPWPGAWLRDPRSFSLTSRPDRWTR